MLPNLTQQTQVRRFYLLCSTEKQKSCEYIMHANRSSLLSRFTLINNYVVRQMCIYRELEIDDLYILTASTVLCTAITVLV